MSAPAPPPVPVRTRIDVADRRGIDLLRRLIREAVRPYLWHLAGAVVAMALVAAMTAASAWLMDPVVNQVFIAHDKALLWLVAAGVVGVYLVRSGANYGQEVLVGFVGQRIIADLQNRLFAHLIAQDVAAFQTRHTGTFISHFTYDIGAMRGAVANALVALGRESLSVLFLIGVMVYQDWLLSAITLLVAPLTIAPLQTLGRRMRRVSSDTQDRMGDLNTLLSQDFQGIRVIKAFAMEGHERDRAGRVVEEIFRLSFRATRVRAAVQPIIDALGGVAVAAVIAYGGLRVIEGATSAGAFFSFITAVIMAYQPLRSLGKVHVSLQEGLAAAERVFGVLDRAPEVAEAADAVPVPRVAGAVRLEDVRFSYDGETPALDGVTFEAPAGGVTALVGPSGAGKSTVFNLIPRFHDPAGGRVLVNGVDARAATLASLRDTMAVVGQEVTLFDDTVFDNIRYGRWDATADEVRAAARAAAADSFIEALPEGWDTRVGEQGLKLSGGQRQRIAIARAILRNAPILLLDEATSALDTESERHIQAALERLMAGRTTIVIAHRLSTIQHAAVIHVFDRGRVVESGDHATLLARGGLYARLHALQFGDAPAGAP